MSLKKIVPSTIAIIVALYIATAISIVFSNILIYSSFSRGIEKSFHEVNPMRRDFRYDYLGSVIFNLPLFLIFSSWGKNNLRKILVPCIILGLLFSQLQYISWWAPEVSGIQVIKGFFIGAGKYFLFYTIYTLIMNVFDRFGKRRANN